MEQYEGKSIYNGIAIGKIWFYEKSEQQVKRVKIDNADEEIKRYEKAKEIAIAQLNQLYDKAVTDVGEANAMIFEVHAMMLEDADYNDSVYNIIQTENVNAEYAVATTGDNFSVMFAEMEDEYFKARSADVKDISERVIAALAGVDTDAGDMDEPVIVVAEDLAPSETVQMDKTKLLGFVTRLGSSNSHTAILARTMNIPALIGVDIDSSWNNKMAIIDGRKGLLYVEPDEVTLAAYKAEQKKDEEARELLKNLKGLPDETLDGKHIKLYANIGSVADVANVLANDAAGIGLFRSEFLYLEKTDYPTEEEQFAIYKTVAQNMAGRKVVIRTLDIGADKQVDYFNMDKEENPAMGYRAIRICLDRIDIFKTQLRALYRASAFGNIAIMFPMIISLSEVKRIKEICEDIKAELKENGIEYGEVELGVMIETPAAVMISDELAKEVDFFSIGTNDLTQYTLAIDRQNSKLDSIYDSHHPAVLKMIKMVADNGHAEGIWVGICGELASDTTLTETFIKMGIDELSVSPGYVLPIRKIIRQTRRGK
ncbi:MAG: phosphoenolpyruvate--protein phosphotransferase [Lachnospiraceae bacterium]|nr:phosphoenolpyruvate--protein phosphotransferase [Lachnospiraceae bacterium]